MLWANTLWAQKVALFELGDGCHTLMENYLRVFAKDVDEKSLVFTSDSAKVSQQRNLLIFSTKQTGMVRFKVYTKRKGKLVIYDSVNVMVYENRYAEVRIGIKTGGKIEQKMLVAYGALYAGIWTRSNHTEPVRVENYTIVFHKSDGSVIVQKNTGNRFNEATIQIMKELQPGERITFTNIQLSGPSSWPQLEAKPVEFTIL
jgi:hypothetical protein